MDETFPCDSTSGTQTPQRYAELIRNYENMNKKLKRELSEVKNQSLSGSPERVHSPRLEDKLKELAGVKMLLDEKKKEFITDQIKAALWHKATSMYEKNSTTRMSKQGTLKLLQRGLVTINKDKWVEVHWSEGQASNVEYKSGYVMLEYADSKDSETFNTCKVSEVWGSDSGELTFSARAMCGDTEKVLVFGCDTECQRDDWINCIITALAEVRDIYNWQKDNKYTLKMKFTKKKIGLLIEERVIDVGEEVKTGLANDGITIKNSGQVNDMKDDGMLPCELIVRQIVDKDLYGSGIQQNAVVSAINDTLLIGKTRSEQLLLLSETPKPFTLTFKGQRDGKRSIRRDGYFSILKMLVQFEDDDIKSSFKDMVKGTLIEQELDSSNNKSVTISSLLDNQLRLVDLLLHMNINAKYEQAEQEFKE